MTAFSSFIFNAAHTIEQNVSFCTNFYISSTGNDEKLCQNTKDEKYIKKDKQPNKIDTNTKSLNNSFVLDFLFLNPKNCS